MEIRIEQDSLATCPVSLISAYTPSIFERSWREIRSNRTDVCLIRLITKGRAIINHIGRTIAAGPGELVITRSSLPLRVEHVLDENSVHEQLTLTAPTSWLQQHVDLAEYLNTAVPLYEPDHAPVRKIFEFLTEHGEELEPKSAELLVAALLREIASRRESFSLGAGLQQTPDGRRIADIRRYIRLHFANSQLSLKMLAEACRVSERSISNSLAKHETCFYEEVRMIRLEEARRLLSSMHSRNLSISRVAEMTGFKSPAHFSHIFSRSVGCSPREYRRGSGAADDSSEATWKPDYAFQS